MLKHLHYITYTRHHIYQNNYRQK